MDYSLPGSSVHGISQARVLEWGDIAFSNVILLSHKKKKKKKNGYAIYSNMNGPRDYHIKWGKTEIDKILYHLYVES